MSTVLLETIGRRPKVFRAPCVQGGALASQSIHMFSQQMDDCLGAGIDGDIAEKDPLMTPPRSW